MTMKMKSLLLAAAFAVAGLFATTPVQARYENSVVLIRSVKQSYDYSKPWKQGAMSQGTGSGFIIDGNRILTNAHNIADTRYIEVKKQNSAQRYPAQVAFVAHDCDLAMLMIPDATFFDDTVALEIGAIPAVNTTVSTYGFPVGGQHVSVTEGVVSRIQMDTYSHPSADQHLVIQTDAAINPGNSGGPVMQNDQVVGVAFQGLRQADNIGYMIPTTVIEHFLEDIADGTYDAYGSLGFSFYPGLHNQAYKAWLKVPQDEQGVVILRTQMHSSVEMLLQSGDVLTRIDEYDIDNDGMIKIYGLRLLMSEAIEQKQIGDTLKLTFFRQGTRLVKTATIALNRPLLEYSRQYDTPPDYVVFAGLTFVKISRNFLETWGGDWYSGLPHALRYVFQFGQELNTDRERQTFMVLSQVMPDEVNRYANDFLNQPIESINGKDIWNLRDIQQAFSDPQAQSFRIQFLHNLQPLILDAAQARQNHPQILDKYQIPSDHRLKEAL